MSGFIQFYSILFFYFQMSLLFEVNLCRHTQQKTVVLNDNTALKVITSS